MTKRILLLAIIIALAMPVLCEQVATASDYLANHQFAVFFTFVAAASQGLGGLIAVVSMRDYGNSVAHLMSFSTGVMVYLSFMDIMFDTTTKIGDAASIAFFAGTCLFMLLEICVPEVEGSQFAEAFGFTAWAPSPQKQTKDADTNDAEPTRSVEKEKRPPDSPRKSSPAATSSSTMRQRATRSSHDEAPVDRRSRGGRSPLPTREGKRAKSPPPSEKRKSFEKDGESGLTEKRKRSISFSGMMVLVSISLHNIPEGIAVYLTCLKGVKSGLPLAVAMALHNIPEGMAVAGPLYAATKSKLKAVLAATISGAFEVVGCMIVQVMFHRITPFFMDVMLSLVAGIMVALSLIELLPSCLEILSPKSMGCSCLGGMAFMFCAKSLSHELVSSFGAE